MTTTEADLMADAVAHAAREARSQRRQAGLMVVARVGTLCLHTWTLQMLLRVWGIDLPWLHVFGLYWIGRTVVTASSSVTEAALWSRRLHDRVFGVEVTNAAYLQQALWVLVQAAAIAGVVWWGVAR